ncbi:NAD(P)-dependent dehydrogenase (short-subunit alcohol dehydrogenase family) [Williamsia limnetica]|uniref:NAD(P)-dependent dehydrogenase (Short-subunit alcohol dehydrogenase family) n=2 Tax=Williamsia limnetica TaxID=882452 RepID=A0A318RWF9_WILLI|nr:NAD(P)-dependent dehydrogenase (short-subunit alcohol dehydrogenase family) [Williamsia limnetica]
MTDAAQNPGMSVLDGKVVVVTGASSGLGAAVVRLLGSRGARVYGLARDPDRLSEVFAEVPHGRWRVTDLADAGACADAISDAVAEFGRLDCLVNVAGAHTMRHTPSVTDEQWHRDLAVNLNGPFFLCRAALPHLLETAGNIVNVASTAGTQGQAYSAAYCAAKHGLIGLTRALAVEYAHTAVRVNAVCPGGMLTPQVSNFVAPDGADFDLIMRTASPRGMSQPAEVAKLIAFLAGDDASAVHGAVYAADNGRSAD